MNRYGDTNPMLYSMSGILMWVMILLVIFVGGSMTYHYMYPSKLSGILGGSSSRSSPYYGPAPNVY